MNIDISINVVIGQDEFTFMRDKNGYLRIINAKTNIFIDNYKYKISDGADFFSAGQMARRISEEIIDSIVKPHMLLYNDVELLLFYLVIVNVVNLFAQNEIVYTQK